MDCSTPGLPPCPSPAPRVYSNSCPLSWWCHPIPSHLLSPPSPSAFNLSQNQGLFKWVSSLHQVAKVLEFQLQHQSFQWIFRIDLLGWTAWISLLSKGLSRVFSNIHLLAPSNDYEWALSSPKQSTRHTVGAQITFMNFLFVVIKT